MNEDLIKPVIRDIAKSRKCPPDIALTVEAVALVPADPKHDPGNEKAGLLAVLCDGDVTIQALFKPELYDRIVDCNCLEEAIIRLKHYELAEAPRLNSRGIILYLGISDFDFLGTQSPSEPNPLSDEAAATASTTKPGVSDDFKDDEAFLSAVHSASEKASGNKFSRTSRAVPGSEDQSTSDGPGERSGSASRESDQRLGGFALPMILKWDVYHEVVSDRIHRSREWIQRATLENHRRCHLLEEIPASQRCTSQDDADFQAYVRRHATVEHEDSAPQCKSISETALRAIMDGTPLQPFASSPILEPLCSVVGPNKTRNHNVDVLAIILSVDPATTKPSRLPRKRDILLMDDTVVEPVVLSVFDRPEDFHALPGCVALFRHVTTHDWRQGSLSAYPARVSGKEWFVPFPYCLGLETRLQEIENWWRKSHRTYQDS